ncbi:FKBP12-interacting protein of 37 kDa [Acorus calamus]|uniref:FKBP12-interacting protein of 37 kDa n=1 Tax=Acorus calamus TaxID=4465 RepID=A0AAV9F8Q9_ACOCL|nr:FKBP12-interacting protein of 37 kDa [Acorus calamus]
MASHIDDEDDFGGEFNGTRRSDKKRGFGEIDDDDDGEGDIFGSKKGNTKVDESAPGAATGMILSLRESLQTCKENLSTCQLEKAKKREAAFVVTFSKREQEIADLKSAVRDLKAQLRPQVTQNLVEEKEKKIKELEDSVTAISFTPHSKNGKSLMKKCKILMAENEEIGINASEGKMHELSMKLALQKTQNDELRNQYRGLYKAMDGLTNDIDRYNEMVLVLQENLEEKDNEIRMLKEELSRRETLPEEKNSLDEKKAMEDANTDAVEEKSEAET